jgi:ParB-like chromosome segregation protein Spo0J
MATFICTKIEIWPVEKLIPYDRNARTHSDEQIEQIARSIQEYGFTNPILVDTHESPVGTNNPLAGRESVKEIMTPHDKENR